MRTYLTVSAGSPMPQMDDRMRGADALVLDGGDLAVVETTRLRDAHLAIYVCVGDVDGPHIEQELATALAMAPTGLVLKATHGRDVAHLGARLAVHEAMYGQLDGSTRIIASIASAAGAMQAPSFRDASERLSGLTWDPGSLSRELGAAQAHDGGRWIAPLAQVRGTLRLAAAVAGVEAIEASCPVSDEAGCLRHLAAARRDAFGAVLVTDPAQIALVRRTSNGCQAGTARR